MGSVQSGKQEGAPRSRREWEAFIGRRGSREEASNKEWIVGGEATSLRGGGKLGGVCPAEDLAGADQASPDGRGKGHIPGTGCSEASIARWGALAQVTPFWPGCLLRSSSMLGSRTPHESSPGCQGGTCLPSLAPPAAFQQLPEAVPPPGPCPCDVPCQQHSLVRVPGPTPNPPANLGPHVLQNLSPHSSRPPFSLRPPSPAACPLPPSACVPLGIAVSCALVCPALKLRPPEGQTRVFLVSLLLLFVVNGSRFHCQLIRQNMKLRTEALGPFS